MDKINKYAGSDNDGNPKSDYLNRLKEMDDEHLQKECERKIWLSAYASNNLRSDYHWQVDACYDECEIRDKIGIYEIAYHNAVEGR